MREKKDWIMMEEMVKIQKMDGVSEKQQEKSEEERWGEEG